MKTTIKCFAVMVLVSGMSMAKMIVVNASSYERLGAWGANIGNTGTQENVAQRWAAFVDGENGEYRVAAEYDIQPAILGISSGQVNSATLAFSVSPWGTGRNAVTVDQISSNLDVGVNDMYSSALSQVFSDGFTGATGEISVDITDILKTAMNLSSASQGISFRWFNDNDADPTAPFDGVSEVVLNTGFNVSGMTLNIDIPEPTTSTLILASMCMFFRRPRQK